MSDKEQRKDAVDRSRGLSVIIPVTERHDDLHSVYEAYRAALEEPGRELQFIFVLDGGYASLADTVRNIDAGGHRVELVSMTRTFGESAALSLGFSHAEHELILTLPPYLQVIPEEIPRLFEEIGHADMAIARRWPRRDSGVNRFSAKVFHGLLRRMTQVPFSDLGCSVRLIRSRVLNEVTIYGDQHRFLPMLADRRGFRVVQVDLAQAEQDKRVRVYKPGVYVSRLLDLISVFFIVRFTKKPLRFFGMFGTTFMVAGAAILAVTVVQRLVFEIALADRPLLLLGSLLLVLGVQLFALGLIGELIIFTHARDLKEYAVAETVNMDNIALEKSDASETASVSVSGSGPILMESYQKPTEG